MFQTGLVCFAGLAGPDKKGPPARSAPGGLVLAGEGG